MTRKDDFLTILKTDASDNWKAAALETLYADQFRDFVYRHLELTKQQGAKWIENMKKSARHEIEKRNMDEAEEYEI
jgi:hypothetical protein